ncbi:MAG: GNAT family N-acetyltransferase [Chloroflexia bacterium]
MPELVVRDGRPEDLDGVLRLWVQMVEFHVSLDPSLAMRTDAEGQESMRLFLQTCLESPDSRLFVAEKEGLAGFLLAHIRTVSPIALPPTTGYITDIYVEESLRRQGIGRALYLAAREWFRERGQSVIRLSVATANPVSQAFWRAMGAVEQMMVLRIGL